LIAETSTGSSILSKHSYAFEVSRKTTIFNRQVHAVNQYEFLNKFHLSTSDRRILKSPEFRLANQNQGLNLVRLAAAIMGLFAFIAFIAVALIQKKGAWTSSFEDSRQIARLGIAIFSALFLGWAAKFETFAAPRYEALSIFVWSTLTLGLSLILTAQFKMSLEGIPDEVPHGRYAAAVIMITIVVYMLGSIPLGRTILILAPVTILVLAYNFKFLSSVEASSFGTYFVIAHVIGITFSQFKFKRDVELFVKNRDLDLALESIRRSEAREKEISAAKTRLIGSVSHDLRQPLNSLALYNNLLKSKFGGAQNAALNSIAERVQECVAAMEGNLTRLQDIAQLQARTIDVVRAPTPLHECLRTIQTVFQPIAEAAKVRLVVRVETNSDVILNTHSERLFEILANLLSNAVKFSSMANLREPWVLVRTKTVRRQGRLDAVQIIVRDNGLGIALENHERIFDEYVQLNNPERQSSKGYGLGLSVVRELSNSLPGHGLRLVSQLGYGARFSLSIPVASGDQIEAAKTQVSATQTTKVLTERNYVAGDFAPNSLSRANIVLVEDDESLRAALIAQLKDLGATVRAYPSTKHALAATANDTESPTCIISDYWLPEPFDGLQTIAKLREQFDEIVPALLISAASDIDPKRLESLPKLEFALKPVSANTLLSYVTKHHRLE
jgi:signal transduction histidine kinase/CheY-like chemotaxis protein